MKKILLYLSLLSLGLSQIPLQGTHALLVFEPEQRKMGLMAKCTLIVAIIATAYGINMLFKAWVGDQEKEEKQRAERRERRLLCLAQKEEERKKREQQMQREEKRREQDQEVEIKRGVCSAAPMAGSSEQSSTEHGQI